MAALAPPGGSDTITERRVPKNQTTMQATSPAPQATSSPIVLRESSGGITLLTLNRPALRNTLSEPMMAALGEALAAIAPDPQVRAVVIAADGPAFCAGHDLKELTARHNDPDRGRAYYLQVMETCSALMQSIIRLPQPVIAAVQGIATAAGCQLVASCDLAVASARAGFCTPGVDIGLFCSTPMVALTRNVAPKHAMEMLLTGDTVSAEHALRIGLVNRVVPPGTEREQAMKLARHITEKSATAVRYGKEAFYRQLHMELSAAYQLASQVMVENMLRYDASEGIAAFLEKRAPDWEDG